MPNVPVTHFNPETNVGWTRCGLSLYRRKWTLDSKDATCNNCVRCIKSDNNKLNV